MVSFYGHRWELYNLAEDRFEQDDVASQHPDLVKELSARWHELAKDKDRQPAKNRKPVDDQPAQNTNREWHRPELVQDWNSYR